MDIEAPVTFVLRGYRSVRRWRWLVIISGALVALVTLKDGNTSDRLIVLACAIGWTALGLLWTSWVGSRFVETLFVWSDGLEIRRGGRDVKVPWNEVEIARAYSGRLGWLAVRAGGQGFRLMSRLEGGDTLEAVASTLELYRQRAGAS